MWNLGFFTRRRGVNVACQLFILLVLDGILAGAGKGKENALDLNKENFNRHALSLVDLAGNGMLRLYNYGRYLIT